MPEGRTPCSRSSMNRCLCWEGCSGHSQSNRPIWHRAGQKSRSPGLSIASSTTGVLNTSNRVSVTDAEKAGTTGASGCESLAQAAPTGTGCNTTAGATGVETGMGLAAGATAAVWLVASAGLATSVTGEPRSDAEREGFALIGTGERLSSLTGSRQTGWRGV